jgi:MFS family permease
MIGLWALAFFPLMDTGSAPLVLLALAGMAVAIAVAYGPQAALVSELFPTHLRYTGASLGYQIGSVLGGGLAPFIAAALYASTGGSTAITVYMVLACLVSLGCALALAETAGRDLAGQDEPLAHTTAVEATLPTA